MSENKIGGFGPIPEGKGRKLKPGEKIEVFEEKFWSKDNPSPLPDWIAEEAHRIAEEAHRIDEKDKT